MNQEQIYNAINEKIIVLLENGVAPWQKPWKNSKNGKFSFKNPINLVSKKPYQGINFWTLNLTPFESNTWGTFQQIKSKGGNIKKGEKGTLGVFWKILNYKKIDSEGKENENKFPILKTFYLFNLEQCENLNIQEELKIENENVETIKHSPIETCENIIKNFPTGFSEIKNNKEDKAYYNKKLDYINLPNKNLFSKVEQYYQVLFHESIHATGHKQRLNRDTLNFSYFGDQVYSQEELVAEMGASYLCGYAGIDNVIIENSAAYIQGWLKALRNDNKLLIKASSQAQKAANYLLGINSNIDSEEE